jgi:hypothetical protein
MVQPPPNPVPPESPSTNMLMTRSRKEKGRSQKEMLFMRGNAISGAPIMSGTSQLPKPPIIAGMIMKKIMMRACEVTKTLYSCGWEKICRPGNISSARISIVIMPLTTPAKTAKMRYMVPMSL